MRRYREILSSDVSQVIFQAFGRGWSVSSFIGRIQKQDVGKRVYLVCAEQPMGDILQVENDEQFQARRAKEGAR